MKSELLCFVQEKASIMAVDDIVKICTDFYKKEEIFAARSLLDNYVTQRLPRRKGADCHRSTVEDLVKCCVDPELKLPTFYATALRRLPPVDASHCDVSAILKELQGLRAEVRLIAELRSEVNKLQQEVRQIDELSFAVSSIRNEINSLRQISADVAPLRLDVCELRQDMVKASGLTDGVKEEVAGLRLETVKKFNCLADSVKDQLSELQKEVVALSEAVKHEPVLQRSSTVSEVLPVLSSSTSLLGVAAQTTSPMISTFAETARNLVTKSGSLVDTKKRHPTAVYGKKVSTSVKAIEGIRRADIFVSRLHPKSLPDDVVRMVRCAFPDCLSVSAEKLETRFDTYSSFHVELCTSRSAFGTLLDSLYDPESWPEGILVRRFFRLSRNGDGH